MFRTNPNLPSCPPSQRQPHSDCWLQPRLFIEKNASISSNFNLGDERNPQSLKVIPSSSKSNSTEASEFGVDRTARCEVSLSSRMAGQKLALTVMNNLINTQLSRMLINAIAQVKRHTDPLDNQIPSFVGAENFLADTRNEQIKLTLQVGRRILSGNPKTSQVSDATRMECLQLKVQNKTLQEQLNMNQKKQYELQKRYDNEVRKKKQSLSALADEIQERDELISSLQDSIKDLQKRVILPKQAEKVLVEDSYQLRCHVERLQKINDKLNLDISAKSHDLACLKSQVKGLEAEVAKLKAEVQKKDNDLFDQEIITQESVQERELVKTMLKRLQRKLLEQQRTTTKLPTSLQNLSECRTSESSNTQENKTEAIFLFLFNISDPQNELGFEELFDQHEKEVLVSHKHEWLRLNQKNHTPEASNLSLSIVNAQDTIEVNKNSSLKMGTKFTPDESLLKAFGGEAETSQAGSGKSQLNPSNDKSSSTAHINKIQDLKLQIFNIRSIILNLLKSLDLRYENWEQVGINYQILYVFNFCFINSFNIRFQCLRSPRPEIVSMLSLMFDTLQFSEAERELVVPAERKKRRVFGFEL